jgi:hypothetical protein
MKVLIGAIGLGRYVGTTYGFEDGTTKDADYFLYAITQHIKPDHLIVVATDKAKEPDLKNNKPSPLAELNEWIALENVPTTVIDIPNGKDRNEAWGIFNAIVEKYDAMFPKGSAQPEVYMDVTNGLRSIPILMLSIARYLQRSRQIDLRGIFYGAFDAVERSENVKPVYQVDSFMTVLDWASAVDTFLTTGNSVHLAEMLEMQNLAIENADEIADSLRDLSTALDLVRIEQIHQCADSLVNAISKVDTEDMVAEGRIIVELLHRLQSEFEPLAIATPQANMRTFLKKNLELVLWYFNRNRYQDAMLVAREWILTYKMQNKNAKLKRSYSTSEIFDRSIRDTEDGYRQWVIRDKLELNKEINDVRNSLLHGGFSDEQSAQDMVNRIENVIAKLQKLKVAL